MKKKILFLQSEIHNYHISLLKEISNKYDFEIDVIYRDKSTDTPYRPPNINGISFIGRSSFQNNKDLKKFVLKNKYELIRTSGWVDKGYLNVSHLLKKKGKVVVVVSDTQWRNSLKQTLGTYLFGWYIRRCFTNIMVAGPYQYEYARKLGFKKTQIAFHNLSADTNTYTPDAINFRGNKTMLYVGRLEEKKGVDLLLEVWSSIKDKNGWKLTLIGNGSLLNYIQDESIVYLGYQSSLYIHEQMKQAGFFVLPSRFEPWGVVMHEAALTGMPILCSDVIGSAPYFLVNGFNGFSFKSDNPEDLRNKLNYIMRLKDVEISKMKNNSLTLSQRITSEISAASLISLVNK